MDYAAFLDRKRQHSGDDGFEPTILPESLFPFQRDLTMWAVRKGRAALLEDCGLGKTVQQLIWAENVVQHTGGKVLILAPLAVSQQTVAEGQKFSIEVVRSQGGTPHAPITITNYERLSAFTPHDFIGCVLDESSILKSFDGMRRQEITEFLKKMPYRLLCTATASPNDYVELGTSSEALGELGHIDMLNRFFRNQNHTSDTKGHWRGHAAPRLWEGKQWRFKGHAELPFWRWVCSWARAVRRPSDLGHRDEGFVLPRLTETAHVVKSLAPAEGYLFDLPAVGLREQLAERRRTVTERCHLAADLVRDTGEQAIVWCHLNPEGDLLESLIPGARQVKGSQPLALKESLLQDFAAGDLRVLITKPKIGAWGLNLQRCAHVVYFPSHSYEQYYQAIRRCWRFGQAREVQVDLVMTEGDQQVMENLQRKSIAADRMFSSLVAHMNHAMRLDRGIHATTHEELPLWLSSIKS